MYDGLKNLEVPRRPPRRTRYARRGLALLAALGLLTAGTGVFVYLRVNAGLNKARQDIKVDPRKVADPINVLVLGSDARDAITREERRARPELRGPGGKRSDTIILIHISKQARNAVSVSFPRDLRVEIPGYGTSKLNTAYARGGPDLVIKTIKNLTGIPIHHYVEINFASFREIVNAVGGVDMCLTRGYHDKKSGLSIPKAGCYNFDGNVALSYVRARYIEDGSDLSRIERQQKFMRSLMGKVKSAGFLFNVPAVLKLSDAVSKGVVLSQEVDLALARGIANRLSGDQKNIDFRVVPNMPRYIGGVSYVLMRQPDAGRLFRAIRDDTRIPNVGKTGASIPKRSDVVVNVFNGAGKNGFAGVQAAELRQLGFVVRRVDTHSRLLDRTLVRFEPGAELKAKLLEDEYPFAEFRVSTRDLGADVEVILGKDAVSSPSPSPDG